MSEFEDFLAAEPSGRPSKCLTCKNPKVSGVIKEYTDAVLAGETRRTRMDLYKYLQANHAYGLNYVTMNRHIRHCLGVADHEFGRTG